MSTQKRKISYWSFDFLSGDEHCFDPEVFCRFMAYLKGVDAQKLLHRDEKQNNHVFEVYAQNWYASFNELAWHYMEDISGNNISNNK